MDFTVVGNIKDGKFHRLRVLFEKITETLKNDKITFSIEAKVPSDWYFFAEEQKFNIKEISSPLILKNGQYFRYLDIFDWLKSKYEISSPGAEALFIAMGKMHYKQLLQNTKLFDDICPRSCENFIKLCTGETGTHSSGATTCYKGNLIHRIVKKGWIQGGDIEKGRGDGGFSIFGKNFQDENFVVKHDRPGILGYANHGPHTNSSQFYVTLTAAPWFDKMFVAFGLVDGYNIIKQIEKLETQNERPLEKCSIFECGIVSSSQSEL